MAMAPPAPRHRPTPIDPRIRARRVEVQRSAGRRRLQRLADVGAVLLVAAGFALALRSPLLDVDRIEVAGAARTGPAAVREALGIDRGEPLVDVDLGAAGARVAALPWVDEVSLHRGLDGTVSVQVAERSAVALVAADQGDLLVDDDGRILGPAEGAPVDGPPLVRVVGVGGTRTPGAHLAAEVVPVLAAAGSLAAAAPGAVTEIDAAGDDLRATLAAGGEVILGDAGQLDAKVRSLVTMLEQVDLSCLAELDVRLPGSPVLTREDGCS